MITTLTSEPGPESDGVPGVIFTSDTGRLTQEKDTLLQGALNCAARGWPVHPLAPRSKAGTVEEWGTAASTDPTVIRAWWRQSPDANIGVVTGQRSGLLVLDVDGPEGRASLEGLEVPATITGNTGRLDGGRHLIYAYKGPTRNRQGFRPGLDVRGDGGYIVVAPSVHPSGAVYSLDEAPLAPAPEWLVQEATPTPQKPGKRLRKATVAWPPSIVALLTDPSDLESDMAVRHADKDTHRDRSKVIARVACTMVRLGETDEGIFRRLRKSTLMARKDHLHDPDGWLRQDIARARAKVESEPEGYQDVDEHVLLARLHVPSATRQKVLRAHQVLCEQQGLGQYVASVRDIALGASCSVGTALTHTNRLVQEGWLRLIYKAPQGSGTASTYRLSLPRSVQVLNTSPPTNPVDGGVQNLHRGTDLDPSLDAARYQALGPRYKTVTLLSQDHSSTLEYLVDTMKRSKATLRRHLRQLIDEGVALRVDGGFLLTPDYGLALERLAIETGVAGRGASQQAVQRRERHLRRVAKTLHARQSGADTTMPIKDNYMVFDARTGEILYEMGSMIPVEDLPVREGHVGEIHLSIPGRSRLDRVWHDQGFVEVIRHPKHRRKTTQATVPGAPEHCLSATGT